MNLTPFDQLSLLPEIRRALDDLGFENATEIQARSIPLIQSGQDIIGRSQTGTGKTLAFGIPAVERINSDGHERGRAQVLILCPTRELAVQACDELRKLSRHLPYVRPADVYGGAPMDRQIARLKTANLVVGTPGRVMDHLRRRTLRLDRLRMIVLDEADEMLSMGFREDIETILTETPEERQTVLFSATMPPDILTLTEAYQRQPVMVQVEARQETVENIEQYYYEVPMGRKLDALELVLKANGDRMTLIFSNTKRMVDDITERLNHVGIRAEGLHGDMKQSQRTRVMDSFKQGRLSVLVATDVAARGIDVNDIETVINYDVPQSAEYYVHRIGRTGRAGKSGRAFTLCSGRRQAGELMNIARITRSRVTRAELPTAEDVREQKKRRITGELISLMDREEGASAGMTVYAAWARELAEAGYPPERIAAAVLLLHLGEPADDTEDIRPARRERLPGGSYRKIAIDIGRNQRVAPNHIVSALAGRTGISGREIGKIEIYDDRTVVGIPEGRVDEVVEAMRGCKIVGRPTVTSHCHEDGPARVSAPGRGRNSRRLDSRGDTRRRH
ncbi:MAG: DEAD/DEAH box helicase [Clostridiales bacterium]|nr:DEAD/DEAH box helicase [Clostridiales bacterium]